MQRTKSPETASSPALFYFLFYATGISVMLLGMLLPQLHLQLNDAQVGRLLATQFTGQMLGALLVTRRAHRSLQVGLFLTLVSSAALALMHTLWWPVLFLYGLGMGITMTATNIAAGMEALPQERVSRLELLNAFWPFGAMCAPLLVRGFGHYGTYLYLLVAAMVLVGWLWSLLHTPVVVSATIAEETAGKSPVIKLLLLCLLGLLAVGVETAVSNWSSLFGLRYFPSTRAVTLAPLVFWIGILSGRYIASRLSKHVTWLPLTLCSSLIATAAVTATAFSGSSPVLLAATLACAVCVAPLYPAVLAQSVMIPGKNFVFFTAGIGSAYVPWLLGVCSTAAGSLRTAFFLPAAMALSIPLLLIVQRRVER